MPRVREYVEDLSGPDVLCVQTPTRRAPVPRCRHATPVGGHAMMSSMRGVTKRIQSIKFALLSPDEIRRMSATKIITADTYDDDGFPIDMGLMDSHLGGIETRMRCKTCGGNVHAGPVHFAHSD